MKQEGFDAIYREAFPFWPALSQEDRDYLCRFSTAVTFLKGATIHDASVCTGVILIKTGCLRVYMLSEEGKELTLYRLFPGEMCMLSASCVTDSITFDVFVDAEENSECYILGGMAFAQVAKRNKDMKIFALEATVSRFSDVMWVMQQVLFMSLDKRLAIFLLDEVAKNGGDTVKLTHEQIAKYMGSAREVVSRMLKYFSSEGIVQVSRGGIRILDRQRLRALSL
ncbi:MAG: Crp/Fnr family transcriptional regulator [Oscillospiraceae bacterium]|nr:Crp/Fnr family transcriptional regulator [Oscillospiraceae bacterium]MBQ7871245.1 Crp/Fnr family transcriptional regulator [Oscillospiraceae bacterium]